MSAIFQAFHGLKNPYNLFPIVSGMCLGFACGGPIGTVVGGAVGGVIFQLGNPDEKCDQIALLAVHEFKKLKLSPLPNLLEIEIALQTGLGGLKGASLSAITVLFFKAVNGFVGEGQ